MYRCIYAWARRTGLALVLLAAGQVAAAAGFTDTKYPIVLVHGLFGYDSILGADYFFGVASSLRRDGANVFVVQVSAANSNEVRGEQLLQQVQRIVAITGSSKVNLIGHSQGGTTARYVLGVRPDLVASITTVGTPHTGTPVADSLAGLGGPLANVATSIFGGVAGLIDLLSNGGQPQDITAAVTSLSTAGSQRFNARFPAGLPTTTCGEGPAVVNGVRFYSWTGIEARTDLLDISDPLLALTSLAFGRTRNDGLVGQCSAHFGDVIRDDYPQNHLDEINQTLGLTGLFNVNPVSLYRTQANRLMRAGL